MLQRRRRGSLPIGDCDDDPDPKRTGWRNRRYQPRLVATNSSGFVNSHSGLAKWRMCGCRGGDGDGGDGDGGDGGGGVGPPGPIVLI